MEKPRDVVSLQAIIYSKALHQVLLYSSTSCTSYNSTDFNCIAYLHVEPLIDSKILPLSQK